MNVLMQVKALIFKQVELLFPHADQALARSAEFKINIENVQTFGDVSCAVAIVLAKSLGSSPRDIALQLKQALSDRGDKALIASVDIAGPGFLNVVLAPQAWQKLAQELYMQKEQFFKLESNEQKTRYLIEFVSANPTGPLHLGHGRGGIIGDTMAHILGFLGHTVEKEFYINDAGNQLKKLGLSFKARCRQQLGFADPLPEDGYVGEYLVDLAKDCVTEYGKDLLEKSDEFFTLYAKEYMLELAKAHLFEYGIVFDTWFSEKTLHDSGAIDRVIDLLLEKGFAYEQDGALWFKSTSFGDDKDRVIRKSTGELTYIAADIAYHKNKFERGFQTLINVLGCDHHGYVKRLKATMEALGYKASSLDVILYQLVTIKEGDVVLKMSKRAGTFTQLSDVVQAVGRDVARFFYLNRKADMPLDFDLAIAEKKSDENPVYYIQYAYVRMHSILEKARQEGFADYIKKIENDAVETQSFDAIAQVLGVDEFALIKKMVTLHDLLRAMASAYHTHLLSYYVLELAQMFHSYYRKNKIIDPTNEKQSQARLLVMFLVYKNVGLCLDLLGLSKPEKM